MAAMLSVIDTVSSVLSVFIQDSGSEDLSNLDMILMSLMSSYSEVGGLLDEISVTETETSWGGCLDKFTASPHLTLTFVYWIVLCLTESVLKTLETFINT